MVDLAKKEKKEPDLLLTVERALRVLSIFDDEKYEYTLQEISDQLKIPKSMTFRTLYTLEAMGYLVKNEETKTYTLGVEIFRLGKVMEHSFSLTRLAKPLMQELNNVTKETVVLVIPDETMYRAVQIASIETKHPIRQDSGSIAVGYLHCGATKKIILAHMDQSYINHVIQEIGLPKVTDNTITDPDQLKRELETIKEQGYAISKAEATTDVFSVGAPIFNHEGQLLGSIGINLPMYRVNENEEALIEWVQEYGLKISERLGYKA